MAFGADWAKAIYAGGSGSIEVDTDLMAALAWDLKQAYEALEGAGAAQLANCWAGDKDGRLSDSVAEYVDLNQKARRRVVEKLQFAHSAAEAAANAFGGLESSLVAALNGKEA